MNESDRPSNSPGPRLRASRQRQAILEELRGVRTHPTADEVYQMVRRRLPHISLGTVYRNLELLASQGLIRRVDIAGDPARFDADLGEHVHIRCVRCGRVGDVFARVGSLEVLPGKRIDWEVLSHQLEFTGICTQCRQQGPPAKSTEQRAPKKRQRQDSG